jgi:hypothetical protein
MAEHIALKKALGNSDRDLGYRTMCGIRWWISSGACRRRLRSASANPFIGRGHGEFYNWRQRYGRVNEDAVGYPEISGWSRGKRKPSSISMEEPIRRLSSTYVHDVRSRRSSRESGERMASVATSGTAVALEKEAIAQGQWLRTAA